MNDLFPAWFQNQLDQMERQVTPPVPPFGWGTDMSTKGSNYTDLPDDFGEVPANTYQGLAESIVRRLITPRGGLIDDPTYGDGLVSRLHMGITAQEVSATRQHIESELLKDDRIHSVVVAASSASTVISTGVMILNLTVTANAPDQDFELILALDGSTGALIDATVTQQVVI